MSQGRSYYQHRQGVGFRSGPDALWIRLAQAEAITCVGSRMRDSNALRHSEIGRCEHRLGEALRRRLSVRDFFGAT